MEFIHRLAVQLPDGTIRWTSPRGRTYTTTPTGARFFTHLARPTGTPPNPNRQLAMPTRKRTRAQERASRVEYERGLN